MPVFRALLAAVLSTLLLSAAATGDSGERGLRGVLVMQGDRILDEENSRRLFVPGSVQKLLVTAAALHHLGAEYRITTRITGTGGIKDGVLAGDLRVHGAGDPTWNRRFFPDDPRAPLRALASELRRRGLRRVSGDLVIDTHRFPGRGWPVSRPAAEMVFSYGAATSALLVDESSVQVEIAPGQRIGDPGRLRPLAMATFFEWENQIVTVGRERHEKGTVDFFPTWQGRKVVVRGEYPLSEPAYTVPVAVPHPDLFAAEVLRDVLLEEGIRVDGTVRVDNTGSAPTGSVLAELHSPPLSEILPEILRHSHNLYAETLLRVLAAEVNGEGRDDEGLALVARFLTDEVGLAKDSFHLDDASGLSPYNLLSPEAVVGLLRHVRRQPWSRVYLDSLATPGKGTLKAWGRLPPLAAKTGTVRHSLALAGYLARQDPEPVIFVAFLNHRTEERVTLRAELAAWLRRF